MLNQGTDLFKGIKIFCFLASCASLVFSQAYASEDQEEKFGNLSSLPQEIIDKIFSDCFKQVAFINKASFAIITGYEPKDIKKPRNTTPPTYMNHSYPPLPYNKTVNAIDKDRELFFKPNKILSYFWYRKIGIVEHISEEHWQFLKYSNIHTVNLATNQIGPEGVKKFAKSLQGTRVHTVDLLNNDIGPDGTKAFVEALKDTNVHTLNLSTNKIGDEGAGKVAKALQGTNIHTIKLSNNNIGDDGAKEFFQSLQGTNVRIVDLSVNNIGNKGLKDFDKALQGINVHTINLSGNKLGPKGAKKFAKALKGTNVQTIDLSNNDIEDEGAKQFAKALQNTNVSTVDLRNSEYVDEYETERFLKKHYSSITWFL